MIIPTPVFFSTKKLVSHFETTAQSSFRLGFLGGNRRGVWSD
jgi:hypothetical protein